MFAQYEQESELPFFVRVVHKILLRFKRGKARLVPVHRGRNRHRSRGHLEADLDNNLTEAEFTRMFRLNRQSFNVLLEKLATVMPEKNEEKAIASSGSVIKNKIKLAITLRWLAGASYLDLMWGFKVSSPSIFGENGILWTTMIAINKVEVLKFPTDEEELERIAAQFSHPSHGVFQNIVGAIDGLIIKTRKPTIQECSSPKSYMNRKGTYGVLCLGVSDINGKFLSFSCNWSGSTHDSYAYGTTSLFKKFENDPSFEIPEKYHLIGDEAFTNTNRMLVPWGGRGLPVGKDSFNYHLSRCRCSIERAFGMLVKRFGVLWRKLECDFSRWPLVATVCAKLHNICMDSNVPQAPRLMRDFQRGDVNEVIHADGDINDQRPARGERRRIITAQFQSRGIRRPILPGRNV